MSNGNKDKSFTLENYLNYSNSLDQNPKTSTVNPISLLSKSQEAPSTKNEGGDAYDFFAQLAWGGVSGLSWGASELDAVTKETGQQTKHWEEMNDWEKAGWVTGEGLSLFVPVVGPFSILGRAGSAVTRKVGNRFIREAAEKAIKERDTISGAYNLTRRGGAKGLTDLGADLKNSIYKGVTSKKSSKYLNDLKADDIVSASAEPYLTGQTYGIIKKITKDAGQELSDDVASQLSQGFVKELKNGRPVNDIAEWTARYLGKGDPGNVSKYMGMVAQDFLYMGLHGLGVEKIDSIVEKREASYSDKLAQSGIMALGFPLIRGIKGGGNDSLLKGAQAYFSRFRKIDYNKIAASDMKAAKGMLSSHINGGNFNVVNESGWGGKFWTVNGTEYHNGKIRKLLETNNGKWFDDNLEDTVGLLNKMRVAASKEFVKKWKSGYVSDLWASKTRLATGILFMNEGAFRTGAFKDMSTQELSSHLFMSALMTKSRGAWGHADKRAYMHKNYGKIQRALDYLEVDHTKFDQTITALDMDTIINKRGALMSMSPAGDSVIRAVDSVLNDTSTDWKATSGKPQDVVRYGKVQELLGLYNAIKIVQDRNFKDIGIDEISTEALERIRRNLDSVEVGGKKVKDYFKEDLGVALSTEFVTEYKNDMWTHVWEPLRDLGFPFQISKDGKTVQFVKPLSGTKEGVDVELPNSVKILSILENYSGNLGMKEYKTEITETLTNIAKERGEGSRDYGVKELDLEVGKIIDRAERYIESKYENHDLHINIEQNIFLDGLANVESLKAKDTLYKAIMGVETDNQDAATLHNAMVEAFGISGKFARDITDYQITSKDKNIDLADVPSEITDALTSIRPIFNLMRQLNKGQAPDGSRKKIDKNDLINTAELAKGIQDRLPDSWTSINKDGSGGLEQNASHVYWRRLMSGGNILGLSALNEMRNYGLIPEGGIVEDGTVRIKFPTRDYVESFFRSRNEPEAAKKVNEAIAKVKAVFHKNVIGETDRFPELDESKSKIALERFIDIAEHISNREITSFVQGSADIINNLNVPSEYMRKLSSIETLAKSLQDNLSTTETKDSSHPYNVDKIQKATFEMREIYDSLVTEKLISGNQKTMLDNLITTQENITKDYNAIRGIAGFEQSILKLNRKFSENYNSINQFILENLNSEHTTKKKFAKLVQALSRASAMIDPDVTRSQTTTLIEGLNKQLRDIAESEIGKKPLEDLVLELNDANKWKDIEPIVDNMIKSMNQSNSGSKSSYDSDAVSILTNRKNEGIDKKNSVNLQQLIIKHPGIADISNPNKLGADFLRDIIDAGEKSRKYQPLWDKYIYPQIRERFPNDIVKQNKEIAEFKEGEALTIINQVFSSVDRIVLSLENDKISAEKKPTKHNLSSRTLDRHDINDGLGGYEFALLQGKATINGRVQNIDESRLVQGEWTWIQRAIDNGHIYDLKSTVDLIDQLRFVDKEIGSIDVLRMKETGLSTDSDLIYMRVSPKYHILFPKNQDNLNRLNTDFDSLFKIKEIEYNKAGNGKALETLKKAFGHFQSGADHEMSNANTVRTKMMFVHTVRTLGPEFDNMMTNIDKRFSIEYNMYKRGNIADGGTSSNFTHEALSAARFHPDPDVSGMAMAILARTNPVLSTPGNPVYSKNLVIDIINDESTFFNNRQAVIEKIEKSLDTGKSARKNIGANEIEIKGDFHKLILGDRNPYESLNETFFLDGNKFASKRFAKLLWALNGSPDEFNGSKTTIMDGRLLGKGFIVYNPEIASGMRGDILAGKSVAKTLGQYSRNYNPNSGKYSDLKPFEFQSLDKLRDGWHTELSGLSRENQIEIPLTSLGVGWNADKRTGVNMSSTMVDFQGDKHLSRAVEMFQLNNVIDELSRANVASHTSNGKLLEFLYKARNEEFASVSPTHSLAEALAKFGVTEANPLIRKQLQKLLHSEFFKILTHRTSRHGEETILTADINNRLSLPTYISASPGTFSKGQHPIGTVYQYGGGSVTSKMADVQLGTGGLTDITFMARDTKSGADFIFSYDSNSEKISHHSSFKERVDAGGSINGRDSKDFVNSENKLNIDGRFIADVENVIRNVHDRIGSISNATHGDIYRLLHGESIDASRRNDNNQGSIGLRKAGKPDVYHVDDAMGNANRYKMTTGMSLNAIPKVLKDQPMLRIEQIQEGALDGLSSVNIFDLRVTLQRDFDGDHLYKYLKSPFRMAKDYSDDMGDIMDYRMFQKKLLTDKNSKQMNMFGINPETGVAGVEAGDVGYSKIASHVSALKRNLATVVGVKGTINYLMNSGIKINGKHLVRQELLEKGSKLDDNGIYRRAGETFQNSLDIWKGVHPINWNPDHLRDYFLYGEYPAGLSTGRDNVMMQHSKDSFFNEGFGTGTNRDFERKLFGIIHNTLKKSKEMYNDVYDEGGKRQPTPKELRDAHSEMTSFFKNPDKFLFMKVTREIARLKKNGDNDSADALKTTLLDYFMPLVGTGTMTRGKLDEAIQFGNMKQLFSYIGRDEGKTYDGTRGKKVPIFSIDKGEMGINASVQGHMLNRSMEKEIFFQKDFDLTEKERGTIQGHLDNLENTISGFEAFGNKSKEEMLDFANYDNVFKHIDSKGMQGMTKENAYGIMREIAHAQLRKEHSTLQALENERFTDNLQVERSRDKLFRIRQSVDILDRKMNSLLSSYKKDTLKRVSISGDSFSIKSQFEGTVYRIKKNAEFKTKDGQLDKKAVNLLQYAGFTKKGWKLPVQKGYEYYIDTNPVKFKNIASEEGKQQQAFGRATRVGELDAEYLLRGSKSPDSDVVYQEILDLTISTKAEIGREYSALLTDINKQKFNFSDKFHYSSVKTDRIIDNYFSRMVLNNGIDPTQLVRYLIQPSIQRNVFYQDGSTNRMPYYKMNNHLVSSVMSWLIKPPMEAGGWFSNADKYNLNGKEVLSDIVRDMNGFRDGKFDNFSDAIKQSNGMRTNSYNIDFDKFSQTTKDVITKDWFYHPVLSRFMQQFYINTGTPYTQDSRRFIQIKNSATKESKYGCNY